jgi:hypothetical protein
LFEDGFLELQCLIDFDPVIIDFEFKEFGSVVQGKVCRVVRIVGEVVVAYDCYFECFTHSGVLVQLKFSA